MSLRPTRALWLPVLGCVVLNLLSRTSADPWLALASAAMLALPVVSLLMPPPLGQLESHLHAPLRVVAGQQVEVAVRIRNRGPRHTPPLQWVHEHPAFGPVLVEVPALAPGAAFETSGVRDAPARGVHPAGTARAVTTAPLGFLRWSREVDVEGPPVIVHPVTSTALTRLDGGSTTTADSSVAVPGAGTEVLDLRPWRPGDARREVSARASARHGRPVVLQREREAGHSLVVLATGGGKGPGWEASVSAAASAALTALWDGRPPFVLADPPPGRIDSTGLLDFFAGVDAAGPIRSADLAAAVRRAGRGGTIVVLAPAHATGPVRAAAAAAGCRVEVLSG